MPDQKPHEQGDGSAHYGGWEVMEIIEKHSDSIGVAYALKHLLRKPKASEGYGTRVQDLRKAVTYLTREIEMREAHPAQEASNAR